MLSSASQSLINHVGRLVSIWLVLVLYCCFFAFAQGLPPYLRVEDQGYYAGNIPISPAPGSTAIVQEILLIDRNDNDTLDSNTQHVHITQIDVDCVGTADGADISSIRVWSVGGHSSSDIDITLANVLQFPVNVCSGIDVVVADDSEVTVWVEVSLAENAIHGRVLQLQTWIKYWEDRVDNPRWGFATDGAPETLGEGSPLTAAVFRMTSEGNVYADGAYYGQEFYTDAADIAEWVPVSEPVAPGDVLELDPDHAGHYRKARGRCSTLVAGVVSTDPGFVLGSGAPSLLTTHYSLPTDSALLALLGIIPVKATDEGGPIRPGDLLVSSSTSGCAMRWDSTSAEAPCGLVGKALEPLTSESGVILTLLTAH